MLALPVAVAAALLAGAGFHALLMRGPAVRVAALAALVPGLAAVPLLVPAPPGLSRLAAAMVVGFTCMRLYDAHVGALEGATRPRLGAFLASLLDVFSLVHRRRHREPLVGSRENIQRLGRGLVQVAAAFAALKGLWLIAWAEQPFVVEHTVKAPAFFVGVVGMFQAMAAIARLLGATAREPSRGPYLAATPAEFWRRYNRVVGQYLHENVFRRVGGRRPVAATLACFLLSGVIHEYVFSLAGGRLLGYQLAYFLVQGLAVAVTLRIRPRGGWAVLSGVVTLAFNLATSLLFLASVNRVLPFYANPLPWGL